MLIFDPKESAKILWENLERVLKVSRAVQVQGARSAETGVYWTYMRISSTAQRSNLAAQQLLKHVLKAHHNFHDRRVL